MIAHNCYITINKLSGTEKNKGFTQLATNVPALIKPAGNDTIALQGVPVGVGYSLNVYSDTLDQIPAESEVIVTDVENSGLTINDKFQVRDAVRKTRMIGHVVFMGFLVKV